MTLKILMIYRHIEIAKVIFKFLINFNKKLVNNFLLSYSKQQFFF